MLIHAQIKVGEHQHRGLQLLGQIEGRGGQFETFRRGGRKEEHLFGVAVGGIGAAEHIALLGAGWHAGGGADPLHIDEHCRYLGKIGQAQKFVHQRNTGPGGGGKGAGSVPVRADHHADGSQFVLCLDNGHPHAARLVLSEAAGIAGKGLDDRGGGRDRIPADHGGAGIERAQGRGAVAVHHDGSVRPSAAAHPQKAGLGVVFARIGVAQGQRFEIGFGQGRFFGKLAVNPLLEHGQIHVEQGRHGTHVDDVLQERPLFVAGKGLVDQEGEGNADSADVLAGEVLGQRF